MHNISKKSTHLISKEKGITSLVPMEGEYYSIYTIDNLYTHSY
jgi:hypothetical protein